MSGSTLISLGRTAPSSISYPAKLQLRDIFAQSPPDSEDSEKKIRFIDLDGTATLSSEKSWAALWQRDRNRFLKNWPENSPAYLFFPETMPPA